MNFNYSVSRSFCVNENHAIVAWFKKVNIDIVNIHPHSRWIFA